MKRFAKVLWRHLKPRIRQLILEVLLEILREGPDLNAAESQLAVTMRGRVRRRLTEEG